MHPNSIRAKGLEQHINNYCLGKKLPYRYKHFVDWLEHGVEGEPVRVEWLRRRFDLSRPAMDKWITIYTEEKAAKNE